MTSMKSEKRKNLDAERVRHLFNYEPQTGAFTRRVPSRSNRGSKVGERPGTWTKGGWTVTIDWVRYSETNLIWLWMTGEWPTGEVDHRRGIEAGNAWSNLRDATHGQNMCNKRMDRRNTSGVKGVSFDKSRSKWAAEVGVLVNGKRVRKRIRFSSKLAATYAYAILASKYHGEFARLR